MAEALLGPPKRDRTTILDHHGPLGLTAYDSQVPGSSFPLVQRFASDSDV